MAGQFIFSVDLELAWGTKGKAQYLDAYRKEREVMRRLLDIADTYHIPLTVATVGMLFLSSLQQAEKEVEWLGRGRSVRALLRESADESLWFAPDIVADILGRATRHEIGCHTCYHSLPQETNDEDFYRELVESSRLALQHFGIELRSFVFPRNAVHRTNILSKSGRTNYRGPDPDVAETYPALLRRIYHAVEAYTGASAPHIKPAQDGDMTVLYGSYFLPRQPRHMRLPHALRLRTLTRTLEEVVRDETACHVWLHPFNLADRPDEWLTCIDHLFQRVAAMRERGLITPLTMHEAELASRARL